MQINRRGGSATSAPRAIVGTNASSHGRASETPAARRNWRRDVCIRYALLILKQFATHHFVHERPEAIVVAADGLHDCLDFRLIGGCGRRASSVGEQLFGQSTG